MLKAVDPSINECVAPEDLQAWIHLAHKILQNQATDSEARISSGFQRHAMRHSVVLNFSSGTEFPQRNRITPAETGLGFNGKTFDFLISMIIGFVPI